HRSLSDISLLVMGHSDMSVTGHSYQYYYTAVSLPGHGLPEFSMVGYVDGIPIVNYNSDTRQMVPMVPWLLQKVDPEFCKRNTGVGRGTEPVFKNNVKVAMDRFNQTRGFHIVQLMYGCEMRDDGSIRGYYQYGYDGKDLMTLDTEHRVYYPLTDQKYLEYGKEELERKGGCGGRGWRGEVGVGGGAGERCVCVWGRVGGGAGERCVGEGLGRRGVWGRGWGGEVFAGEERCVCGVCVGEGLGRRGVCVCVGEGLEQRCVCAF
uniref:MHC class I-like antigen recognition-like domain-containing protein n=1 Tax=Leptobrachium leishanense TaxID=445787 RepID=A0A8C5QNE9_9ANUR